LQDRSQNIYHFNINVRHFCKFFEEEIIKQIQEKAPQVADIEKKELLVISNDNVIYITFKVTNLIKSFFFLVKLSTSPLSFVFFKFAQNVIKIT